MSDNNIDGKVVVITGASSGLGEATARHLVAQGARVVLGARRIDRLQAMVEEMKANGGQAIAVETDVSDKAQVQHLVDTAITAFGRIDVLINNAGLMPHSPLERLKVDDWDRMIDVNLKGVLYGIAAVLPHMQRQKWGTSSTSRPLPATRSRPTAPCMRPRSTQCARCPRGCARR